MDKKYNDIMKANMGKGLIDLAVENSRMVCEIDTLKERLAHFEKMQGQSLSLNMTLYRSSKRIPRNIDPDSHPNVFAKPMGSQTWFYAAKLLKDPCESKAPIDENDSNREGYIVCENHDSSERRWFWYPKEDFDANYELESKDFDDIVNSFEEIFGQHKEQMTKDLQTPARMRWSRKILETLAETIWNPEHIESWSPKGLYLSFDIDYENQKRATAYIRQNEGMNAIILKGDFVYGDSIENPEAEIWVTQNDEAVTFEKIAKLYHAIGLNSFEREGVNVSGMYGEIPNLAYFKVEKVLSSGSVYIGRMFGPSKPEAVTPIENFYDSDPFRLLCKLIERLVAIKCEGAFDDGIQKVMNKLVDKLDEKSPLKGESK